MTAFRIVSGLCFLGLLAVIAADLRMRLGNWHAVRLFLNARWRASGELWKQRRSMRTDRGLSLVRRIAYMITLVLSLILCVTGFLPILFLGQHMSGVLLVVHVTIAPLFALMLAVLSLIWSHRLRLRAGDWTTTRQLLWGKIPDKTPLLRFILKSGFWLVLFCALPLLLSIILSLFPLFGMEGQEYLRTVHGYSALVLMMVALLHMHALMTYVEIPVEHLLKEEKQ